MQSSYAMFMIFYKARVAKQLSPDVESELVSDSTEQLVEELRRGLERIILAVSNYSLAFEALDGMRGQYINPLLVLTFKNHCHTNWSFHR
jgi:diphthamide synthase (EF-2-diphthine--ammonia ligase)